MEAYGYEQRKQWGKQAEGNRICPSWSQRARMAHPMAHHLTTVSHTRAVQLSFSPSHAACQTPSLKSVSRQLLDLSGSASDQSAVVVWSLHWTGIFYQPHHRKEPYVASSMKLNNGAKYIYVLYLDLQVYKDQTAI